MLIYKTSTEIPSSMHYMCRPSTQTGYQAYLSCYSPNFNKTLKVGSWNHLEQIPTVSVTFVQGTSVWYGLDFDSNAILRLFTLV